MSDIPFLELLGQEMRRATHDDPGATTRSYLPWTGALAGGVAGIAALLLILGSFVTPEAAARDGFVGPDEGTAFAADLEVLAFSYENIRAEIYRTQESAYGPDAGEVGVTYPRDVLDGLGADFDVLYVPAYLPEGHSLYGKLRSGDGFGRAPRVQTQIVNYDDLSFFVLEQYAQGFTPPSIENLLESDLEPIDVEGLRLYAARGESGYFIYFFEMDGTWFDVIGRTWKDMETLPAAAVAKMAMSLVAYEAQGWDLVAAVVPTVPVLIALPGFQSENAVRGRRFGCWVLG